MINKFNFPLLCCCLFLALSARDYGTTPTSEIQIKKVVVSDTRNKLTPQEKLYRAIRNDSAEDVKAAAKAGIDINHPLYSAGFPEGNTPLVCAVLLSKSNAAKALLELGANSNTSIGGPTLLGGSYTQGNTVQFPYFRVIDYAVLTGDLKSALALLQAGAEFGRNISRSGSGTNTDIINDTNIMGYTLAYYNQDSYTAYELIKELFKRGYNKLQYSANTQLDRVNPWVLAIRPNAYFTVSSGASVLNKELIELFIANGLDINQSISFVHNEQLTPLAIAIRNGDFDSAKLLLEYKADPNKPLSFNKKTMQSSIQLLKSVQNSLQPTVYNEILKLLRVHGAKEALYDK